MRKRKIKILIAIIFAVICIFYTNSVFASKSNYNAIKNKNIYNIQKLKVNNKTDITNELIEKLEYGRKHGTVARRVIIYIPSGTYMVKDDKDLVIHSNTYIVAENDTIIEKKDGDKGSIIKTNAKENSKNIYIFGGVWNGNDTSKKVIEIAGAKNVKLQNIVIKNSKQNGLNIAQGSTVTVQNCIIRKNKKHGIGVYSSSNLFLKNSEINNNLKYGIAVEESTLYANNDANNRITWNSWAGITSSGKNAKLYIQKNIIDYNGRNPRKTLEGKVGHGIALHDGTYAQIINNEINNNRECGISIFNNNKKQVYINNNRINNNGRHGIGARKKAKFFANKNVISSNSCHGIMVSDSSETVVTNNIIKSNKKIGISVTRKSKVLIYKNNIYKNKRFGINIDTKSKAISIYKNKLNKNGSKAIRICGNSNVDKIKNNTIKRHNDYGIYIKNSKVKSIKGNKFIDMKKKKQIRKV